MDIEADGRIWLGGSLTSAATLTGAIEAAIAAGADRHVLIRADQGVAFGAMVPAMDAARAAGASGISFVVRSQ